MQLRLNLMKFLFNQERCQSLLNTLSRQSQNKIKQNELKMRKMKK